MNRRDRRAASKRGGQTEVHDFARAMELHRAGRFREAAPLYRKLLQREPRHADALNLLGLLQHQSGLSEEALSLIAKAIAIDPNNAAYHSNRGLALRALGQLDQATESLRRAIALQPNVPELHNNLGNVMRDRAQLASATASYETAISLQPDYAEAHNNLGVCLRERGEVVRAEAAYRTALALAPAFPEALNNLGELLSECGQLDAAVTALHAALAARPDYPEAHDNLGSALGARGEFAAATQCFRRALALRPGYSAAHSNLLVFLNYDLSLDDETLFAEHRAWATAHAPAQTRALEAIDREPERKLRVGYVSGDLGQHPVGYLFEPVLRAHDKTRFESVCFSDRLRSDDFTERLRAHASAWHATAQLSSAELAALVRHERIDILIDLAGHTARNRMPMFAQRAAPLQASWLGYFNTTGLSTMDYLIMDGEHLPVGSERCLTEAPLRLACGRLCYAPPANAPAVSTPPSVARGYTTYGSFNNMAKVGKAVIALWAQLLRTDERSRLLLKWRSLENAAAQSAVRAAFSAHGVEPARVELRGYSPHAQMLAEYADIDVALDPFPFTGGLTSCEALYMGVPVVTLPGSRPVSRQSMSLLSRIGLAECAATGPEDYVARCVRLAGDEPARTELRHTLRARMLASTVCDGERFTHNFERGLRAIWQRFCAGERPSALTI